MAKINMIEQDSVAKKAVEKDEFLSDFTAKKTHVIVQNDTRIEFVEGKKASETNEAPVPSRYEQTLKSEGII